MIEQKIGSEKAVVIIPEIYGTNQYIKDWMDFFILHGYDTYCVNQNVQDGYYSYAQKEVAYNHFISNIGFDRYKEVDGYMMELRGCYKKIIVFGSSVGATIAWRLTESVWCDGVIGFYGSRIRDYLDVIPNNPCLLIFPEHENTFKVQSIIPNLLQKDQVEIHVLPGKHGFADPYGDNYYEQSRNIALDMVKLFLTKT